MKVCQASSGHSIPIVNVSENSKPNQKIQQIKSRSWLKKALKFSAIAGAGIFSLGIVI